MSTNPDSGGGNEFTTTFVDEDSIPDPPTDEMINPSKVPCWATDGAHAPVVTDVIHDGRGGHIAVVHCIQCGCLCDPSVAWSEYDRVEEGS